MSGISKSDFLTETTKAQGRGPEYYKDLRSYPSGPNAYPTSGMAPGYYDPGQSYPFGFNPEGYVKPPEEEEEDEDYLSDYDSKTPQSTNVFGQPIPKGSSANPIGGIAVDHPSEWLQKRRQISSAEFGENALSEIAGLLSDSIIGYSPKVGKQNISRYPSLFDYV